MILLFKKFMKEFLNSLSDMILLLLADEIIDQWISGFPIFLPCKGQSTQGMVNPIRISKAILVTNHDPLTGKRHTRGAETKNYGREISLASMSSIEQCFSSWR